MPDKVVVWAVDVDIHLNPEIGCDWQPRGQQKGVLTPGHDAKRHLAGALDARIGELHWVTVPHKRSGSFVGLLRHLARGHREPRIIDVIVDNYGIHSSRQTQPALADLSQIHLHFLRPCSPTLHPLERTRPDLHANLTRNRRFTAMEEVER